jgi:hypothetical protein
MKKYAINLIQHKMNFEETRYYALINNKMIEIFYFKRDRGYSMFNTTSVHNLGKLFGILLGKKNTLEMLFWADSFNVEILERSLEGIMCRKYLEKALILSHASYSRFGIDNSINFISNSLVNLESYLDNHSEFINLIFENIKLKTQISFEFNLVEDFNFYKYESIRHRANTVILKEEENVLINNNERILFSNEQSLLFDPNIYTIKEEHEIFKYNTNIPGPEIENNIQLILTKLKLINAELNSITIKNTLYQSYNENIVLLQMLILKYDIEEFVTISVEPVKQFITSTFNYETLSYRYEEKYIISNIDLSSLNLIKKIITIANSNEDLDVIMNILEVILSFKIDNEEFIKVRSNLSFSELNIENEINKEQIVSDIEYLIRYYTI